MVVHLCVVLCRLCCMRLHARLVWGGSTMGRAGDRRSQHPVGCNTARGGGSVVCGPSCRLVALADVAGVLWTAATSVGRPQARSEGMMQLAAGRNSIQGRPLLALAVSATPRSSEPATVALVAI
jgi:hypothetical protein